MYYIQCIGENLSSGSQYFCLTVKAGPSWGPLFQQNFSHCLIEIIVGIKYTNITK